MMRRVLLFVVGAALSASTAAYAHHSYAATYDTSKDIKLEGKLVQFVYRNPHSFVHLEVTDEKGETQRWAVEWSGGGQLANQGVQKDSLKVGDIVVINGRPSRVTGEFRALMVTLKRPADGFTWGGRGGQVVD
jgi:hypothetical protein